MDRNEFFGWCAGTRLDCLATSWICGRNLLPLSVQIYCFEYDNSFFFLKKCLEDICFLFVGLVLVMSTLGSKPGQISHLHAFLPACRFTSGVTPANLLMGSLAVGHNPCMHFSAEISCRGSNRRHPTQKADALSTRSLQLTVKYNNSIQVAEISVHQNIRYPWYNVHVIQSCKQKTHSITQYMCHITHLYLLQHRRVISTIQPGAQHWTRMANEYWPRKQR